MASHLDIWKLLAGFGIFLFGMLSIGESINASSGRRAFRRIIRISGLPTAIDVSVGFSVRKQFWLRFQDFELISAKNRSTDA